MSETNGHSNGDEVIRIDRKGRKKFALGDGAVKEIDVVAVHNEWARIDRRFRVDGQVPDEQREEHDTSSLRFARDHLGDQSVNQAEAWAFLARIAEEVAKLEDFFTARLPEKPASPASSTTIVTLD